MKKFALITLFLITKMGVANAQSWAGAEGAIDTNPKVSDLLLNQLEIVSIDHGTPTKIHPRANLSVRNNTDPLRARDDDNSYLSHFKNSLYNKTQFVEAPSANKFIENYAGYDKASNFSFSTRVERDIKDRAVLKVMEVMTKGVVIENRQYFETQMLTFNSSKKLDTHTYCSGYLYRAPAEGTLRRLYRKEDRKYNQAKFSCKTLTRPLCNTIYRQGPKVQKAPGLDFKSTAYFDRIERDVLDLVNYQQIQKTNMEDLKTVDKPGGNLHRKWPEDPLFHHYSGLGEDGNLTRREATWLIDQCKSKMAHFFDSYELIPTENPNNPTSPARGIGSTRTNGGGFSAN